MLGRIVFTNHFSRYTTYCNTRRHIFRNYSICANYNIVANGNIADYTFTVAGKTYTPVTKDGLYYIDVEGINPQDLDETITVAVNDALIVSYSPMHYMVRMNKKGMESLKTLVKAMYNYHLAAEAFCLNIN